MGNKQARALHRALQRPNDPARLKRDLLKDLRFVSDEEDKEPGVNWRAFAYPAPDKSESVAHHEPDPPAMTCAEYFCAEA